MNALLQNKLMHFEAPPPEGVWERIENALDESEKFPSRLFAYETAPPPGTWARILNRLQQPPSIRTIPVRRIRRPLAYAGAAAAVLLLAFWGWTYMNKQEQPAGAQAGIIRNPAVTSTGSEANGSNLSSPPTASRPTWTNQREPHQRSGKRFRTANAGGSLGILNAFIPRMAQRKSAINFHQSLDKYMIYSDGDGKAIRLPKKMFDAFVCPDEDISCRQRIRSLQEKIASSAFSSDFTGVLEIVSNLKENQ